MPSEVSFFRGFRGAIIVNEPLGALYRSAFDFKRVKTKASKAALQSPPEKKKEF